MKRITTLLILLLPFLAASQRYILQGRVYDKDTAMYIQGAQVDLYGSDGSHCTTTTDTAGRYSFGVPTAGRRYDTVIICMRPNVTYSLTVNANPQGYFNFPDSIVFVTGPNKGNTLLQEDFELVKAWPGHPYFIHGISFEADQVTLTKASCDTLQKMVRFMKANPNMVIKLTDEATAVEFDGGNETNKKSSARAMNCMKYLLSQGIDPVRLSAGSSGPFHWKGDVEQQIMEEQQRNSREPEPQYQTGENFIILQFDYHK